MSYANSADGLIKASTDPSNAYRAALNSFTKADLIEQLVTERKLAKEAATRIANLQRLNDTERQQLEESKRNLNKLGEYIIEQANDNDLCSVFDAAVEQWNYDNPLFTLPTRRIEESHTITIQISSRRPQDAEDLETAEGYMIDNIRETISDYLHNEEHEDIGVELY